MNPFETYQTYLSLKNHFSNLQYDCFKYNFKTSSSVSSFEKRRDKYQFIKLSKHKDIINFIISNIMKDNCQWIGDLFNDQAELNYINWKKTQESITYIFSNEINNLLTTFNDNFIVKNGKYPFLFKLYQKQKVSTETIIILNEILNFLPHWYTTIEDKLIFPSYYLKIVKYKPFIKYDLNKCKKILKESFYSL